MTIIITIIATLLITMGLAHSIMGLIALGMNDEVSNKVRSLDFLPAIAALALGIGMLIWWF